jgi:hypothetical protein
LQVFFGKYPKECHQQREHRQYSAQTPYSNRKRIQYSSVKSSEYHTLNIQKSSHVVVTDSRDNNHFRTDINHARHQEVSDSRGANIEESFHNRLSVHGTTQVVLCPAASKAMQQKKRRFAPPAWSRVKPVVAFFVAFIGDDRGFLVAFSNTFAQKSGDHATKRIVMTIGPPGGEQCGVVSQRYSGAITPMISFVT